MTCHTHPPTPTHTTHTHPHTHTTHKMPRLRILQAKSMVTVMNFLFYRPATLDGVAIPWNLSAIDWHGGCGPISGLCIQRNDCLCKNRLSKTDPYCIPITAQNVIGMLKDKTAPLLVGQFLIASTPHLNARLVDVIREPPASNDWQQKQTTAEWLREEALKHGRTSGNTLAPTSRFY